MKTLLWLYFSKEKVLLVINKNKCIDDKKINWNFKTNQIEIEIVFIKIKNNFVYFFNNSNNN